jgi:hypothetical protein
MPFAPSIQAKFQHGVALVSTEGLIEAEYFFSEVLRYAPTRFDTLETPHQSSSGAMKAMPFHMST